MLSAVVPGSRADRNHCLDRIHAALNVVSAGRNGAAVLTKMLRGVARAIGARSLRVELAPNASRIRRRAARHVISGRTGATERSQPLAIRGRRLGVLYAQYSGGCPTPSDQSRLALAAQELAVAAERAVQAREDTCQLRIEEVVGVLAHELRTPLAAIGSALDILARPGGDAGIVRQARELAERQVRYQASLLDGMVDLIRIAHGTIELRRSCVDLNRVIAAAIEVTMPSIRQLHQVLTVSLPDERLITVGDETRLQQVIVNLLGNATKYTAVGGRISIRAGRVGDAAVICVRDSGAGIPPAMRRRVFEPFVQAAPAGRGGAPGGLGVGLALVKRLVEAHGGTVEARSAGQRRGIEFVVRLRLRHAGYRRRPRETAPGGLPVSHERSRPDGGLTWSR